MNASRIARVVAVLALFAACEDQPTAVNEVGNLGPELIQTDKGNWIELWRVDWAEVFDNVCLPEPALGEGTSIVWGKVHAPPAGDNTIANLKVTFSEDTHLTGLVSGTRWDLVKANSMLHQQTKHSDGMSHWKSNIIEHYESEAGEQIHMQTNYWYVFDQSFDVVSYRMESSCGPHS